MVGLVVVSHSKNLALALVELVKAAGVADIPIVGVGGVGEDHKEIGTDGIAISEAIQSVFSPDGVLVLMDLGSAILNAEMARDILPEEMQPHIQMCAAPLVEGAVAAAVQIGLGSGLEAVALEAKNALRPKAEQIGDAAPMTSEAPTPPMPLDWSAAETITLAVPNEHGLHARPAARFVKLASSFDAEVMVKNLANGKGPVPANSLNSIATLGARQGEQIEISAKGREASNVLAALRQFAAENFGDALAPQKPVLPPVQAQPRIGVPDIQGTPISDGIALGVLRQYHAIQPRVPDDLTENPEQEWQRVERALKATHQAIQTEYLKIRSAVKDAADIFEAHLVLLDDPVLLEKTKQRIYQERLNALKAWKVSIDDIEQSYLALDDPYLRQRAADVRDVGNQVLRQLSGAAAAKIELEQPVILLARELTPSQTAQLDMRNVLGMMTQIGGATSHSAILARSLGIPAVVCANDRLFDLANGTFVAFNGNDGAIWIAPDADILAELEAHQAHWRAKQQQFAQTRRQPAITKDGQAIEIAANIGNVAEATLAADSGAEAIGLLRSEFLYLDRANAPTEDEQYELLTRIGQVMTGRTVIVRTLDVGGDKNIPYLNLPQEDNPFLGVRAVRLCFQRPDIFATQLRAILRAGKHAPFRVMFPMIALVEDFQRARESLANAHDALLQEGIPHQWPLETGIMVETPSAAVLSPELAKQADFFSIGTNDLTQYTFAADRGNPQLRAYADALHPAALRLIKQICDASHQEGKWTGVCGELAGNPLAVPLLAGLGVDELSMNAGAVPKAKAIIRALNIADARQLALHALETDSHAAVRQLAKQFLTQHLPEDVSPE